MPELGTYGSVGAPGRQRPGATRHRGSGLFTRRSLHRRNNYDPIWRPGRMIWSDAPDEPRADLSSEASVGSAFSSDTELATAARRWRRQSRYWNGSRSCPGIGGVHRGRGGGCGPRPCAAIKRAASSGSVAASSHRMAPPHFGHVSRSARNTCRNSHPHLRLGGSCVL